MQTLAEEWVDERIEVFKSAFGETEEDLNEERCVAQCLSFFYLPDFEMRHCCLNLKC